MGAGAAATQSDGGASTDRGDGEVDRQSQRDQDECGVVIEWIEVKWNDETRMTNDEGSTNPRITKPRSDTSSHSDLVIPSGFDIRHSTFSAPLIATSAELSKLLPQFKSVDRVA